MFHEEMEMKRSLILGAALIALAACAGGPENQRAILNVTMTGTQEVPGPGDPDATGTAQVRVTPSLSQVCWDLYARGIDAATAAHIHRGEAGIAGPVVLMLATPGDDGHSQGCASVDPALAREIAQAGHGFYVNVHTSAFPNGALRGQLRGGPRRFERQPINPGG